MNKEIILNQTNELIEITRRADLEYNNRRESKEKGDFYEEVKPFADHAHSILKEWKVAASNYLIEQPKKNIHQNQVAATAENIELVVVQCFFPETSYKRFKSYIQSSLYVLEQLGAILEER
ncbi:YppE family protein [Jeotgalibacillus haloalkalitolerans]|uniref:YppE family protein n=1 Tax=Jeotgalibacillus haloalkalitolerans TaxID=3104292 RepID=A0ABU5KMP0_9BACL|nr:YppE family protein [Jeotgalibacillus sp. HH7-29]MDZ5711975.1 YppE family protein [Jeotgalibacillus sp. HH7-29]